MASRVEYAAANKRHRGRSIKRLAELAATKPDRLYLHSMPGRYEPVEEFLGAITERNIRCVVCLAQPAEIRQKSPAYTALLTGMALRTIGHPIVNFGIPDKEAHSTRHRRKSPEGYAMAGTC